LGTLINNDNSVEKEIQRRILAGNKTYFAAINLFRSRLLSRATKIPLYKTLIRPVVSYGAEAWTMTKKEQALLIFERKIFRRIYDPKYEKGGWTSRTNRELEEMSKGENIVIIIIIIYLSWSWATCWPVPVSRVQKSLQRSAMIPSASRTAVFHYPG
jgi:hypothetical protein